MVSYCEKRLLCSLFSFSGILLALMLIFMVDYAVKKPKFSRFC